MSAWRIIFCCTATEVPTASSHERWVCRKECVPRCPIFATPAGSLKFSPHTRVGIRESAEFDRTCEDPVLSARKIRKLFPRLQALQQFAREVECLWLSLPSSHRPTICSTMPRRTLSREPSQSTSAHRSASASLMRRPKHTQSRAIVANGSCSSFSRAWNCSAVRLRALRTLRVAPCSLRERLDCG
jgi:hypothetical protein